MNRLSEIPCLENVVRKMVEVPVLRVDWSGLFPAFFVQSRKRGPFHSISAVACGRRDLLRFAETPEGD